MSIGIWQLILILCIIVTLFGVGKLPRVMGDIGKGIKQLRHELQDDEKEKGSNNKDQKESDQ